MEDVVVEMVKGAAHTLMMMALIIIKMKQSMLMILIINHTNQS
jgi:hypothetical protein